MYPQFLGCLGQVGAAFLEGIDDMLFLEFLNGFLFIEWRFLMREVGWEIFFLNVSPLAVDKGVFDDILKFPHVALI